MKQFKWLSIAALVLSLCSCTGMNGGFDCNKVGGKGVGCASMEQVNQMANEGQFSQGDGVTNADDDDSGSDAVVAGKITGLQTPTPQSGMPLRYGESVQNIWVAPYTDTDNNYHWAQMVTMIVAPGHWIGSPVSAIQASGDN